MEVGEYILGLLAIISGLAISEMIGGFHTLLFNRQRVKWDWLAPLAAVLIGWSILVSWWISWASNHDMKGPVIFGFFLIPVAQLVCLFLAARGILPNGIPAKGKRLELADHYFAVKRYVWLAMSANLLLLILARGLGRILEIPHPGGIALTVPILAFGTLFYAALAFVDNRMFHRIALPVAFAILAGLTATQTISA